jgi:hypothetical protein
MNGVFTAALEVQNFLLERQWKFCFIGGLAVQKWAEPRATDDVDITLLTGFGTEEPFIDALLSWLKPRRPDALEFALTSRVLLAETESGVGIDIAMAAFPYEDLATQRARMVELTPGFSLRLCSAEDLIIFKTLPHDHWTGAMSR